MPDLHELQRTFGACLRDEHAPPPATVVGGRFSAAARMQVYRNNHRASLRAALAACYPVVVRLTGEGFFAYLADAYLREHPSRAGNLHDFGAALPAFLEDFEAAAGHPYLADVAGLEWARQEAYHAAPHAPLDTAALAAVAPADQERLIFRLHPACRLVASRWPVAAIFAANQPDAPDTPVHLDAGGETVLVSRPALEVRMTVLETGAAALLAACAAGRAFGEACALALAEAPATDLGACMQSLVLDRVLVDFRPGN